MHLWRNEVQPEADPEHSAQNPSGDDDETPDRAVAGNPSVLNVHSTPSAVAGARAAIRRALDAAATEPMERATMCGSELVANAVRHGAPPIHLIVKTRADSVVVVVQDGSRRPPIPRIAAPTELSGRGTLIIERLSDRWGVEFLPDGKRVWCLFDGARTSSP